MLVLKVCGGAILVAFLGLVLSELGFRGKKTVTTLGVIMLLLVFVDMAAEVVSEVTKLSISDEGRQSLTLALKIIGVGHAFNICADICSELSESGIASAVTLIGRVEILLMILPSIVDLIKYSSSILT